MRRRGHGALIALELLGIVGLVILTRCANYRDVFIGGEVHFVDADCYARMTRARICFEHPGTVVRRHSFENFPEGISPHTTAPFDYLIIAVAEVIRPFTHRPLDIAGAIISPLLAVVLAGFLWWCTLPTRVRFRFALLLLYAVSPLLAQGTALGRPDHQSLLIAIIAVAVCAEWTLARKKSRAWTVVSGAAWALALWVSLYEPLILLLATIIARPREVVSPDRRSGWITFAAVVAVAFLIERRLPVLPDGQFTAVLRNWSGGIGELTHVPLVSGIWFEWCSWLLALVPLLLWRKRTGTIPTVILVLLSVTFALTLWQVRWGYFFVLMFLFVVPQLLAAISKPVIAAAAFAVALIPVARAWDSAFSETQLVQRAENDSDSAELRTMASALDGPFLAPWWLSPALTYWSHQSAVAGSSHESIGGIVDTARFFGTAKTAEAEEICARRRVRWVISYDADRLAANCSRILHQPVQTDAVCYVLDRNASAAPGFLRLVGQTARFKLYRIANP